LHVAIKRLKQRKEHAMTNYTAHFYTEADWAEITIKAPTPELALQRARQIESEETETLDFQSYDSGAGVEHIEIRSADGNTVAEWRSKDLLIRLAASELLEALKNQTEAAQAVIDNWSNGDLAAAVRGLDASIAGARAAIAKATPAA
jgi:tellurite resistance protein